MDGAQRVPRLRAAVPSGSPDAFEAWRWLVSPMFEFDTPEREQRLAFGAEFEGSFFGAIRFGVSRSPAAIFERSHARIARSSTDHFLVQTYKSGGYRADVEGRDLSVSAGDVAIFDLTRPVSIRTDQVDNVSLVVSRTALEPMLAEADDVHGLVLREGSPGNRIAAAQIGMLERQSKQLTVEEAPSISHETLGLLAGAIGASGEARDAGKDGVRKAMLRMMCGEIDAHLTNPEMGIEWLIARFRISRASIYRLFEPLGGVTSHIKVRRLRGAFHDLADPDRLHERISTIAYRWGFEDHTSFGRAFRDHFGMTPRDVRNEALGRDENHFPNDQDAMKEFAAVRELLAMRGHRVGGASATLRAGAQAQSWNW